MSANRMDNHCLMCSHEWVDKPGQWANHYFGCPNCGSLYWISKEKEDDE